MLDEIVTFSATPNIALVKYWGKRRKGEDCSDPALNLPQNSSLSITLEAGESLITRTSVVFSNKLNEDAFYLDGKKQDIESPELKERFAAMERLKELAGVDAHFLIVSSNSFPTASGMASSASGLAALVSAAAKALDLDLSVEKLSEVARIGSGSACRSLFGGFVEWKRGKKPDGTDSVAEQTFDETHWPELAVLTAVVSQDKKKISSRAGMRQTVETSELYKTRPEAAERNIRDIKKAIAAKDFAGMAEITMRDSMMMHAVMMDTKPPIIYLNDVSRGIIHAVEALNTSRGEIVAAYTFDAGPNAVIITRQQDLDEVIECLKEVHGVERLIHERIGSGPKLLARSESLINPVTMQPKVAGPKLRV